MLSIGLKKGGAMELLKTQKNADPEESCG